MDKIKLVNNIYRDRYTDYVCDKFDIQDKNISITEIPSINIDELNSFEWNIGLICGNSGSGKSTVLNSIGNVFTPTYDYNKCVASQFVTLNEEEVVDLLTSVGLSSIPVWLHYPNQLSTGEKARLDVCSALVNNNGTILIDEFTSVVNRDCAKSLSFALQRYVRKKNLHVILASCHFDIIEWIKPDWIFNLNKQNNGNVDIERMIYNDTQGYTPYQLLNNKEILSEKKNI